MISCSSPLIVSCIRCSEEIPLQNRDRYYDRRTGETRLMLLCPCCNLETCLVRPEFGDWSIEHVVDPKLRRSFHAKLAANRGDVQADKPNPAAGRTLAMAAPCFNQIG